MSARSRAVSVVLATLAALAALAGCGGNLDYAPLPVPEGADGTSTTAVTIAADPEAVVLPAAPGSTTSVVGLRPGPVTLTGRVDGPDGPVAGAIVRLERLVGTTVATLDVPTAADGTWNAQKIIGGQYRVRAWSAPSLGMTRAQVVFVESPRAKPVVLRLDRFGGTEVAAVVAPDPPPVDAPVNVKVRVSVRQVDGGGLVRAIPSPGVSVTLAGAGGWTVASSNPGVTDASGSVTFQARCGDPGEQPLVAVVGDQSYALRVPPCATPVTTAVSTTTTTAG